MTDSPIIRPARPGDAPDIARLILLSAPSFLPAVFGPGIAAALVTLSAGRGTLFSHEHARVAEAGGRVAGMILGYTGAVKAAQDPATGLALLRLLGAAMISRLGKLLRMQSTIGRMERDDFYVSNLAVYPAHRGQGTGSLLIECACIQAGRDGASAAVLDVETDNEGAISLYERLGFRRRDRTPEIRLGGRTFAFLRMSRGL